MHFQNRTFWRRCLMSMIAGLVMALVVSGTAMASGIKFSPVKKQGKKVNYNKIIPVLYRRSYYKLQGSETDGRFLYNIYWNKHKNKCIIVKINAKGGKRVKTSHPLNIDHGNDLTYNPDTKLLYTVGNHKKPQTVSIISPVSLRQVGAVHVNIPPALEGIAPGEIPGIGHIAGIAYDSTRRQYALRISHLNEFIITDESFGPLRYVKGSKTFPVRHQSLTCDQDHIYSCMDKEGSYNLIIAYSWKGKYQYHIRVPIKYEIQAVFRIGSYHYATFYDNSHNKPKSYIYRFRMPQAAWLHSHRGCSFFLYP